MVLKVCIYHNNMNMYIVFVSLKLFHKTDIMINIFNTINIALHIDKDLKENAYLSYFSVNKYEKKVSIEKKLIKQKQKKSRICWFSLSVILREVKEQIKNDYLDM